MLPGWTMPLGLESNFDKHCRLAGEEYRQRSARTEQPKPTPKAKPKAKPKATKEKETKPKESKELYGTARILRDLKGCKNLCTKK